MVIPNATSAPALNIVQFSPVIPQLLKSMLSRPIGRHSRTRSLYGWTTNESNPHWSYAFRHITNGLVPMRSRVSARFLPIIGTVTVRLRAVCVRPGRTSCPFIHRILLAVAALVALAPTIALAQHHHGPSPRPPTPPVQPAAIQQQIIQQQMQRLHRLLRRLRAHSPFPAIRRGARRGRSTHGATSVRCPTPN